MNSHVGLHADLALGRRELSARFRSSPPYTFRAGEILVAAVRSSDAIHHLQGGWACQFRDLLDGRRRAIVDIYLPGDVIGPDTALRIRPLEEVMTLTSLTIETINTANALSELMACRPTALYIAWLLGQR